MALVIASFTTGWLMPSGTGKPYFVLLGVLDVRRPQAEQARPYLRLFEIVFSTSSRTSRQYSITSFTAF